MDSPATPRRHSRITAELSLLALAIWIGVNLRAGILGVPPLLNEIAASLHIDHTTQGLLTSLPVLGFGIGAIPGARLVGVVGSRATVVLALGITAIGEIIRGLPMGSGGLMIGALLFGSSVLGLGIGLAQPALPRLFRAWAPHMVARTTAMVTFGLITGQLLGATATVPWLRPVAGGWRGSLMFWAIPTLTTLFLVARRQGDGRAGRHEHGQVAAVSPNYRRLLHSAQFWRIAMLMVGANLTFFTATAWLGVSAPGGFSGSTAVFDNLCLNVMSLPAVAALAASPAGLVNRRGFYLLGAIPSCLASFAWMAYPAAGPLWAAVVGVGGTLVFSGAVVYPATLRDPASIAPFSALLWTVGCGAAFLGPFVGGLGIDALAWNGAPFAVMGLAGVAMIAAATTIRGGSQQPRDEAAQTIAP